MQGDQIMSLRLNMLIPLALKKIECVAVLQRDFGPVCMHTLFFLFTSPPVTHAREVYMTMVINLDRE